MIQAIKGTQISKHNKFKLSYLALSDHNYKCLK